MSATIKVTSNTKKEGSIKVAFATNDSKNIDAHFGGAKEFHIYDISQNGYDIASIIKIEEKDTEKTISLLDGVDIVYFINIGATAAAKIINHGIFPIKYKEVVSIEEELSKITTMLSTNPPPFIKKILTKKGA